MTDTEILAGRFETHRGHLRSVAYRMLGSLSEADDAVQETWLRASRSDTADVENLGGWLTTILGRICLNMLRARQSRREESIEWHVPDPIVSLASGSDPEQEALQADAIGLGMLVVMDRLAPAERLAFVLHDAFSVPFEEIAPVVERSEAATRQLASRARRRVQAESTPVEPDQARQRDVIEAFRAASRGGDFEALISILDPDVVIRTDFGPGAPFSRFARGARKVAEGAAAFSSFAGAVQLARVNGSWGYVASMGGALFSIASFTVRDGRIAEIYILGDPDRLRRLDLTGFGIAGASVR